MATILSHGVAASALTKLYTGREKMPVGFWTTAIGCSIAPDLDVIGLRYGVPYGSTLGHRGFSHSLLAAGILAAIVALIWSRVLKPGTSVFLELFLFFFLVTASHGILDAFTNGGLGVAFFSPLNKHRYFFPWRPILVSPIGARFFSERGVHVLINEARWIWMPSAFVFFVGCFL